MKSEKRILGWAQSIFKVRPKTVFPARWHYCRIVILKITCLRFISTLFIFFKNLYQLLTLEIFKQLCLNDIFLKNI